MTESVLITEGEKYGVAREAHVPKFELVESVSLQEACAFLSEKADETKIIAGGTDILVRIKQRLLAPRYLLNIKSISDMTHINSDSTRDLKIGALATLDAVGNSPIIQRGWPALSEAARGVAALQHRTRATIGGNICLNTRCWYYNQALPWRLSRSFCFKMGGDCCHVVKRGRACFALFSADTVPVLIALDARVKVASSKGERVLPLKELYTGEGRSITKLATDEILTEIVIPAMPERAGAAYLKHALRTSLDFPLVGVAVFISLNDRDGICSQVRIVFTGVVSGPVEAHETEATLVGSRLTDVSIARASQSAAKEIKVFANTYCSAEYRKKIMEACTQQAFMTAMQRIKER